MLRVCLAGPAVIYDSALVSALAVHCDVDLVPDPRRLDRSSVISRSDVLVLDAGGLRAMLPPLLRALRLRRPELPIVLVDGSLSEHDKADAFSLGVLDYFPAPCHVGLLVERLQVLARTRGEPRVM